MREIIHIQVGQCGNQIGSVFWNEMNREHKLNDEGIYRDYHRSSSSSSSSVSSPNGYRIPNGVHHDEIEGETDDDDDDEKGTHPMTSDPYLDRIGVYFVETQREYRYYPRALLVDLEPGTKDAILVSNLGKLFKKDNFIFGVSGAGNNWAKGHYTEGAHLADEVCDALRKEVEACDCPQGFQLTHSLGGGTGSGLGTLMLVRIRDSYPDRITCTYSVYPSPKVSDVVVEPYNATLAIHQLIENSDETFVVDNEALYNISHHLLKHSNPRYAELNEVIALAMGGMTASLRFSGQLNGDLRKIGVNLVPFPRLHFFALGQAPLFASGTKSHTVLNVRTLNNQMWSRTNCLANFDSVDHGKYLAAVCIYRGPTIPSQRVDEEIFHVQSKQSDEFVEWIPNNVKTSIINVASPDVPMSGTFVANTTCIKSVFKRISGQFKKMYSKKAFMHWYKGEGMDESEFIESNKNILDLIEEMQDKQDVVVNLDESDNDESEFEDDSSEEDELSSEPITQTEDEAEVDEDIE